MTEEAGGEAQSFGGRADEEKLIPLEYTERLLFLVLGADAKAPVFGTYPATTEKPMRTATLDLKSNPAQKRIKRSYNNRWPKDQTTRGITDWHTPDVARLAQCLLY